MTPKSPRLFAAIGVRVWVVVFWLHIRRVPITRVLDACVSSAKPLHGSAVTQARVVRYVDFYCRVLRLKCLERSLLLCYFLRRLGVPVTLNAGVRRVEGELQGHAWLSLGEELAFERDAAALTYTRVLAWPAAATRRSG